MKRNKNYNKIHKLSVCLICKSPRVVPFDSYKHRCLACCDCNSISHLKKSGKYLLEFFLPWRYLSKILPRQATMRLFHAPNEKFDPSQFYDGYANLALSQDEMRKSKVDQLIDIFEINKINIKNKKILDISGGPGEVAFGFKKKCKKFVVTEYSETSVAGMKNGLGVEALKFDYLKDNLVSLVKDEFDIIMIRSSIIFCEDLEKLLWSIKKVLKPNGLVLLETITPSLGEVFWWQQMEYKFPVIYSQMAIETFFYKSGFSLIFGYRESGSYEAIKWRGQKTIGRRLFTWLIDYPMVLIYWLISPKRKIPIDTSLEHKFLTLLWRNDTKKNENEKPILSYYKIGKNNRSPHFSCIYNGYLRK